MSQLSGGNEQREEELLLHRVLLASIAQHSTDVYWMLDEGRLRCGSAGFLGRLVGAPGEACLWRVLDGEGCGRLGRKRQVWQQSSRGCSLIGWLGTWCCRMLLGENRFFSFRHQDGTCGLRGS